MKPKTTKEKIKRIKEIGCISIYDFPKNTYFTFKISEFGIFVSRDNLLLGKLLGNQDAVLELLLNGSNCSIPIIQADDSVITLNLRNYELHPKLWSK